MLIDVNFTLASREDSKVLQSTSCVWMHVNSHKSIYIYPISLKFWHKIGGIDGSVPLEDEPDCNPDSDFMIQFPVYGCSFVCTKKLHS